MRKGNYLSSSLSIENGLKQGDALSALLFNFTLKYAIRKVHESNLGLNMDYAYLVLTYAKYVHLVGHDIRKNRKKCGCVIRCRLYKDIV